MTTFLTLGLQRRTANITHICLAWRRDKGGDEVGVVPAYQSKLSSCSRKSNRLMVRIPSSSSFALIGSFTMMIFLMLYSRDNFD